MPDAYSSPGRIGLVVNPTSGKRTGAWIGTAAAGLLTAAGLDVTDLSGPNAAVATGQARRAIMDGAIDTLVVTGGDGMVHLGVNLVAGTDTRLGIVAAGTGNDIARELGLPIRDAAASVQRIVAGRTRRIDAVRRVDAGGDVESNWFVGVLAAGFDAVVNERANRWAWPKGQMRYNLAVVRELPVFRAIDYRIQVDGTAYDTEAMLVAVGNGPAYGGGMRVVPGAEFDDGLLDVLIVHRISIPAFLRVFPRVFSGAHVDHPAVHIVRGRRVQLQASGIVGYADGERFGPLPLDCQVVPGAVTVLA